MMVKVSKKVMLVLTVVMLLGSTALSASAASPLVGGGPPGGGNPLEHQIEGGIKIVADRVTYNGEKPLPNRELINGVWYHVYHSVSVFYRVTSIEDTTLRVEAHNVYDNLGHEFNHVQNVLIGGQSTRERFIVGDVPTMVEVEYRCPSGYELASVFPRAGLSVNGQSLIFREVPGRR